MKKVFISIVMILLAIFVLLVLLVKGIPKLNTEYTKDFSYQKFSKVAHGMTREQVRQILGDPFLIWNPGYECWRYSRGDRKINGWIFDGWVSVQVCFKDDKVIHTPKNVF